MTNKFLVSVLAFSLLSGCSSAVERDFSLNLMLRSEENSDDSNSQTETLEINGTHGEYTWVYEGYHPSEDFDTEKSEDFDLTAEQVESLKMFLSSNGLDLELEESKSTGEFGNTVEMTLELEIEGEKTNISIAGMSAIYGSGHDGESNLENFATVESAQDLIYTVKDLGGLYDN